ncbi:MAG: putative DNA binding domain-containing protein [Anaerolineae bacterium]|nr:putative DNA binding domain-containing protein [Anaerolineae bacterium]
MLSDEELLALWRGGESDRVEFKRNAGDADTIRKNICAFANDLSDSRQVGVIFIGVDDDGSCANIQVTDEIQQKLSHMHDDGKILPPPSLDVQKRVLNGCEVLVVIVQPSSAPPVRFDGRVFVRIGTRTVQANPEDEQRLVEKRRHIASRPFDLSPVYSATLDDLDLDFFRHEFLPAAVAADVIRHNQRSLHQQLAALGLLSADGLPTVAGLLICGEHQREFIPGAYVQFVRYAGDQLTAPIQASREISGKISEIARRLDEILLANIHVASDIKSQLYERRSPDYPIEALRQLMLNALMHRTYEGTNTPIRLYWFEDRVEILSPGGLYGIVANAGIESGMTDYRNPTLASAMKHLGLVQRFGVGIQLAKRALAENGNPPPQFTVSPVSVLVTVRRRP